MRADTTSERVWTARPSVRGWTAGRYRLLLAAQAVAAVGLAAGGTAGPLLAASITGSETIAPVPLGLVALGSGVSAPFVTALMRRRGRALGLAISYASATLGVLLVIAAAAHARIVPLLAGSLLLGIGNTGVMLGRYATADAAPVQRAGRAVSAAMTAVTVGAVGGPLLLGPAGLVAGRFGLLHPAGLYLVAVVAFPVAAGLTLVLDRSGHGEPARPARADPAGGTAWRGQFLPWAVLGTANLSMVSVMGAAPAHMHGMGWSLDALGVLVAAHIGAMFGPSSLSGRLRDRVGSVTTALAGCAVMLVAALLLAAGDAAAGGGMATGGMAAGGMAAGGGMATGAVAVVLVGLGWNLQVIGGTTLLVERSPQRQRHRAEGLGELVMGFAAAAGTLGAAGPLLALGGLPALCAAIAAVTAVSAGALVLRARR